MHCEHVPPTNSFQVYTFPKSPPLLVQTRPAKTRDHQAIRHPGRTRGVGKGQVRHPPPSHQHYTITSTTYSPQLKPRTPNPKPHIRNPKPKSQNPKPQTPNLKSQTSSPKPQTSNPKPQNPNPTPHAPHPTPSLSPPSQVRQRAEALLTSGLIPMNQLLHGALRSSQDSWNSEIT